MKQLKVTAFAAGMLIAGVASAEPVKITNIGHGYFSGALYVAVQEKLFQKYGLEPEISYVQGGPLALQAALFLLARHRRQDAIPPQPDRAAAPAKESPQGYRRVALGRQPGGRMMESARIAARPCKAPG